MIGGAVIRLLRPTYYTKPLEISQCGAKPAQDAKCLIVGQWTFLAFRHIYPAGLLDRVIADVLDHRRDGIIADAGYGTLDKLG
jgi:hypothetical protein